MTALKLGDLVCIKSGGPSMTVTDLSEPDHPLCQWFDIEDMLQGETFPLAALEIEAELIGRLHPRSYDRSAGNA